MTGPEHYREAKRLLGMAHHWTFGDGGDPAVGLALATEALAYATLARTAAAVEQADITALAADIRSSTLDQWYPLTHGAEDAGAATLTTDPSVTVVYRAARGPFPLGTYTTQDSAREHCEADAINVTPELDGGIFDWLGDESAPDDPYELIVAANGVERITDYTVTRVTVESEYDSEADA